LHKGHLHAIQAAKEQFGDVTVVVGSAQEWGTEMNPLPVEQRVALLRREMPDVKIMTQNDIFNDREWARQIRRKVDFDVAITGNDWVKKSFSGIGIPVEEPEWYMPEKYNGTRIRRKLL